MDLGRGTARGVVKELSNYEFLPLRGGDSALQRGSGEGLVPVLLACTGDGSLESRERLAHEYALRADLDASWAARPIALSHHNGRWTLVLEDPGGEPLDQLLHGPLATSDFLRLAIPLTKAVHQVHERGLIHKNLKPSNILVHWATSRVWLTGFGIASRLLREHSAPAPPEVIAGTLAYMAPEQTGRMNRSVDSRSDLYSLGVTFYEMLTGRLPFSAADAMGWVHCHTARQAVPPDEPVKSIPKVLSSIVMKLLAKTPEDRYQTAAGLDVDLRQCSMEWEALGRIPEFPLARRDLSQQIADSGEAVRADAGDRGAARGVRPRGGSANDGIRGPVRIFRRRQVLDRERAAQGSRSEPRSVRLRQVRSISARHSVFHDRAGLPGSGAPATGAGRGRAGGMAHPPARSARPERGADGQSRPRARARHRRSASRRGPCRLWKRKSASRGCSGSSCRCLRAKNTRWCSFSMTSNGWTRHRSSF